MVHSKQNELTAEQIEEETKRISTMTHEEMAELWRFAPAGHNYFRSDLPLYEIFNKRFQELGGMTPGISKQIGP